MPRFSEGMQFFLAQVEQGKDTVCEYLRTSAVKKSKYQFIWAAVITGFDMA